MPLVKNNIENTPVILYSGFGTYRLSSRSKYIKAISGLVERVFEE